MNVMIITMRFCSLAYMHTQMWSIYAFIYFLNCSIYQYYIVNSNSVRCLGQYVYVYVNVYVLLRCIPLSIKVQIQKTHQALSMFMLMFNAQVFLVQWFR